VNSVRAAGVVVALLAVSCSSGPNTRAAPHAEAFGPRTFRVQNVHLAPGAALSIGLHPTQQPVKVEVTPAAVLEVCPATLDGDIDLHGSSWPVPFRSCIPLDASGHAVLPATNGFFHVAFALRSPKTTGTTVADVAISYSASDSFVQIGRPAGSATTTVVITPRSTTVGAHAYMQPGSRTAPDALINLSQSGHALRSARSCDFGSEIPCVGGVTPKEPVTAVLGGNNKRDTRLVMFLTWL
jgi:hypothetical protein